VVLAGRPTIRVGGVAVIAKSGDGPVTTSVTVVLCVRLPLLPVMISVYVPGGVEALVVTVIVEEPLVVIVPGLNEADAPMGKPLALNVTVPVNPPAGVTVTV